MGEPGDVSLSTAAGSVDINAGAVAALFNLAPRRAFYHFRDAMGAIYGSHRRDWLARTQAGMRKDGMRAEKITSSDRRPSGRAARRTFYYRVRPASKTVPKGQTRTLDEIEGEAFSTSDIALGLEKGGTHRAKGGRMLAIPIGVTLDSLGRPKSRWTTPTAYKRASARNELVALKLGRTPKLYQVKGGKKAAGTAGAFSQVGKKGKGKGRRGRSRILLPAYLLVPRVQRKARLRYMSTWDELASDRQRRLSAALTKIVGDLTRG